MKSSPPQSSMILWTRTTKSKKLATISFYTMFDKKMFLTKNQESLCDKKNKKAGGNYSSTCRINEMYQRAVLAAPTQFSPPPLLVKTTAAAAAAPHSSWNLGSCVCWWKHNHHSNTNPTIILFALEAAVTVTVCVRVYVCAPTKDQRSLTTTSWLTDCVCVCWGYRTPRALL